MPEQSLELRDIHLPAEPGWFPPAPGWWLVLAAVLLGAVLVYFLIKYRKKQARFRQEAISLIEELLIRHENRELPAPEAIASISATLKRVAITLYGREQVAKLSGQDWLDFLDAHAKTSRFQTDDGRALVTSSYQADTTVSVQTVAALAKDWIREQRL